MAKGMELTVLGACGSWPAAGEATSGYLLADSGFVLPIDLGTGTFARLQERLSAEMVSSVVITHAHPDHFVDLYALFYFRLFHAEPLPPVELFAPPGLLDAVTCYAPPEREAQIRSLFRAHDVMPGQRFELGPFAIRAYEMRHQPATIGLRVTAGDLSFTYSADTGPSPEIVPLASNADLFLCEATSPRADPRAPNHLTASDAGRFAQDAQVRSLLLTHLWPTFDPDQATREAAGSFEGEIAVARGGLTIAIGEPN
jgi:ribonuclease BN (tRNA processing enzyme)